MSESRSKGQSEGQEVVGGSRGTKENQQRSAIHGICYRGIQGKTEAEPAAKGAGPAEGKDRGNCGGLYSKMQTFLVNN